MKKFFTGYIKSVNWSVTLFFYLVVVFISAFDNLTFMKFLSLTGVFFLMTLLVYYKTILDERINKR